MVKKLKEEYSAKGVEEVDEEVVGKTDRFHICEDMNEEWENPRLMRALVQYRRYGRVSLVRLTRN